MNKKLSEKTGSNNCVWNCPTRTPTCRPTNKALARFKADLGGNPPKLSDFYHPSQEIAEYQTAVTAAMGLGVGAFAWYFM